MTIALPVQTPRAREAATPRLLLRRLVRGLLVATGIVIVVLGIVIAPLPGPMGLPVVILGLVIVLRNSFWAKRAFVRVHRRHPRMVTPVRRLLRRDPPVGPVFWQMMLRTEKFFLPRRWRALRRLRRMSNRRRA